MFREQQDRGQDGWQFPSRIEPARRLRRPKWIEVRRSPIHGRGVFAVRSIPARTVVAEYRGERLTWRAADARYAQAHASFDPRTYLMCIDRRHVLDATRSRCRAKWLNHSCEPNCEALIDGGRIFIQSIGAIDAGEELFLDYALQGGDEGDEPLYRCLCGTASCRGTMLAR